MGHPVMQKCTQDQNSPRLKVWPHIETKEKLEKAAKENHRSMNKA
ncbi:Arc family DNA-binding protein [Vreelandella aquamarina]